MAFTANYHLWLFFSLSLYKLYLKLLKITSSKGEKFKQNDYLTLPGNVRTNEFVFKHSCISWRYFCPSRNHRRLIRANWYSEAGTDRPRPSPCLVLIFFFTLRSKDLFELSFQLWHTLKTKYWVRRGDQWNRIESQKKPHSFMVSGFLTRMPLQFNWGRESIFSKCGGTAGYPHSKNKVESLTHTIYIN